MGDMAGTGPGGDAAPTAVLALDGEGDLIEPFEVGLALPIDGAVPTAAAPDLASSVS